MTTDKPAMPASVARDLLDLDHSLSSAAALAARGRAAYDSDEAIRLAFEALSNRVGEAVKRLGRRGWTNTRSDVEWSAATRHRDFVVHSYGLVNPDRLWNTITADLPRLHKALAEDISAARAVLADTAGKGHPSAQSTTPPQ